MNIRDSYDTWSNQYDEELNRTRDLEALALRETFEGHHCQECLEMGCGTGKNTSWLMNISDHVTAVDFSTGMLNAAKEKIGEGNVSFIQQDLNSAWELGDRHFDLATFSLVLEHIRDLNPIFKKLSRCVKKDGTVYVGELHPYRQYNGSKARFDMDEERHTLTCFTHHISDFTRAASEYGFVLKEMKEYFDDDERSGIPRILVLVFRK